MRRVPSLHPIRAKPTSSVDRGNVKAQYDPKSGRLKRLEVDTNKNGVIDAWTYQDGTRIDRIEIDKDENGKIDRWEHYVDGKLARVGTSTRGDGVEDEWAFQRADGSLERVETDTDRDGRVDKWETFDAPPAPGGRASPPHGLDGPRQQRTSDPAAASTAPTAASNDPRS